MTHTDLRGIRLRRRRREGAAAAADFVQAPVVAVGPALEGHPLARVLRARQGPVIRLALPRARVVPPGRLARVLPLGLVAAGSRAADAGAAAARVRLARRGGAGGAGRGRRVVLGGIVARIRILLGRGRRRVGRRQ